MEQLTNREKAILIAALRIIMVTVRDESRPFYVDDPGGPLTRVAVSEVDDLLDELGHALSPGEAADLWNKGLPFHDPERDQ